MARTSPSENTTTTTTFMTLPPELRLRIYALLLSGHTIHINHRRYNDQTRPWHVHLCTSSAPDESYFTNNVKVTEPHQACSFDERHNPCFLNNPYPTRGNLPLDIQLLRTSPAIRAEASELFFQTTLFTFDSPQALLRFHALLTPAQRRNVRRVQLCKTDSWEWWRLHPQHQLENNVPVFGQPYFPCLREVRVYLEVDGADLRRLRAVGEEGVGKDLGVMRIARLPRVREGETGVTGVGVQAAIVACMGKLKAPMCDGFTFDRLEAWGGSVRRMLLPFDNESD